MAKKKAADRIREQRYCSFEDRETKCPNYEKPKYSNAHYCIWQAWTLECLNPKEVKNEKK